MDFMEPLRVLWDYLRLGRGPEKADVIVGFGSFDLRVARRGAELYLAGFAPKLLFTGGLGRCTEGLFPEPEAVRFGRLAAEMGVPERDILLETRSTNTRENIDFTRALLESQGIPHEKLLGVHKPYMERRIAAAMGVYWPEARFTVTSPEMTVEGYLAGSAAQGMTEKEAVSVIVGDFQRMDLYAKKGYQLPQVIPEEAWAAYRRLLELGYDTQLAK